MTETTKMIYNDIIDLSNCFVGSLEEKTKVKKIILNIAFTSMMAYKHNPEILNELEMIRSV